MAGEFIQSINQLNKKMAWLNLMTQAARVSTVNEIVHNWNARGTLQATGQVLAQHAQKIREGMGGLQKAATALQNSLNNPNLDPKNRAVLEKALQTAQKYIKDAEEALERVQ